MTLRFDERRHGRVLACCGAHDFTMPGAERHYPPDLGIEPVHLEIDLRVDVVGKFARGKVVHHLRGNRIDARTLTLDAVDLEIESVKSEASCAWSYDGRRLEITWERGFDRGETRTVSVEYAVHEPVTGLFFAGPSAAYPETPRWAATDHETERARHWLPTIDHPSVRPTLDIRLRAAAELSILANGVRVGEQLHDDGTKTVHWKLEQPCPSYLTCFCIGELVRVDAGRAGHMELSWFATKDRDPADLVRAFDRTADMVAWMTEKLGRAFPYPKYFQFALPGFGGAMENISLVSWDDVFLLDATLHSEWKRLVDQINVHEMAHAYFGNLVTCRDFAHAWLKESWATYMESCWFEHDLGLDERDYELWECAQSYFGEADNRYKRPIVTREFNSSWDMYDLHLYPGGAVRLHMLRCLLGDETFWAGVRLYVERFAEQVVETDDFRRVMEEVSGRSLGRFFDQWFHRAGYPHLSVDFEWDAESRRGTFMIEQKQAEPDGKDDAIFELEFELAWTAGGTTSARRVVLDRAKQSFAFAMDSDPEQVRVDPRHELVLKLDFAPGDRRLRAQLQAKDVVGRIQAAAESCKSGTAANVRAVRDACAAEGFWGVRVAMVRALAGAGTRASIDALIEVLAREEDPRVIEAGLRASLSIRDDALAVAVEGLLDDGLPYRASAAALEFLGAQREQAPVERLADAAASESYAGIVQAGALRGLAHSRSEDALEALLERSAEGRTSNRARPIAAESLGNLARLLERRPRERAVDRLVDLLRDPSHRVRGASVRGLDAARAREAVGALERHRTALAVQDQAIVDRVLRSIRGSHEPRIGALEKQLEEMRARVRKLDERMERLSAEMEDEEDEDEDDADDDDARD